MRIQRRKLIVISTAVCLIATGIGSYFALQHPAIESVVENVRGTLEALAILQQDIASRYPVVTEIGLETDNVLVISLVNSPFNDLTETEQQNTAQEIAQFAKDHYTGSSTLRTIQVSFIKHSEILGVSTNRGRTYAFKVMD
jgi:hypothetical protein